MAGRIDAGLGMISPRRGPWAAGDTLQPLSLETLATAQAGSRQKRFAFGLCLLVAIATVALLPFVGAKMPPMPGFVAVNQTALLMVYALTTALFLMQYRRSHALGLLLLGAGSLYTTLIVLAQLVCFPNMFSAGLLVGQGPATLTWLWNFWHLGPPLFAVPYAIISAGGQQPLTASRRVGLAIWLTCGSVLAAAALTLIPVVRYVAYLPVMADADGGYWPLTTSGIGPILILLTAGALAILWWRTRMRSVLQLWLGVSLVLLLADNIVTDFGAARATVGWFVGRMEALLAGIVILGVYLKELDFLHREAEAAAFARESARAEAQAARDNLEIALDASGMGDWELNLETGESRRTLRHDRIFGYPSLQPNWDRARLMEHVHPSDRSTVQAAFASAEAEGRLEVECRINRADDGAHRWIAMHGRTYYDRKGRPISMAGCVIDVSDRRSADERLRQTEQLEAIGQLTGGVAHDFNNLLTVMLGALEIISNRSHDAAKVEKLAKSAFAAGRRGTELTEKLLSFSRRQVVEEETVNVNRLVGEFQGLMQQAAGEAVVIELDLDPSLDPVRLDPNQLQAAFLNLVGNARDAMPSGGRLRLETRNVPLSDREAATLAGAKAGNFVRVTISDTGTGMDAATAAKAFEPFFTTKEVGRGTGLGLSQVYGFAHQSGGFCAIRTAPGAGCSIELYFPRKTQSAADGRKPTVPLRPAANGEVVLVVEDEDTVREMAAESLESLGYGVLTAPDARVALDILRGPNRVDILFSDVVMPGGMNGAQLALEGRTIRPNMRILLTSGYTATATGGARELPPGVPLLRKPYLKSDLAAKLSAVAG